MSNANAPTLLIRDASIDDCPLIAWAFLAALGLDDTHVSRVIEICQREDTIYSWKRTRIACIEGQPAGCLISYPGSDYEQLRESTWQLFDDFWPKSDGRFEPETYAGEYYLDSLAVLPTFRHRGVAKALLLDGVHKGKSLDCNQVTLIAESDNPQLLRYYKNVGFTELNTMNFIGHRYTRMQYGQDEAKG